jgi:hypothetical protein
MKPFSAAIAALLAFAPMLGCSGKLDQKECDKLRGGAFDLINAAHHCNSDADCRQSNWPSCPKPVSNANFDKVKPMAESFKKGQCEEEQPKCNPPPDVYCKQGLCVHREKGAPEGAAAPPADQIQVK